MSSGRNKQRIYFCVYFQQGPTGTHGNPRVFHCGLWVEPKNSRGSGDFFHVQYHPSRPVNRPDYPLGWVYDSSVSRGRRANWRHSGNLIGRILLGKLPDGVTAEHIHQVCSGVPMPRDRTDENCWDWTRWAIEELQRRRWLRNFTWTERNGSGFADRAYRQAVAWFERDPRMEREHDWDIFGTENGGGHCQVM